MADAKSPRFFAFNVAFCNTRVLPELTTAGPKVSASANSRRAAWSNRFTAASSPVPAGS